ncbi:MAG: hypothetical protein WDM81_11790 [Rhizomicrobium sp.]
MPSLRDRRDDIPALARHFIARFAAEENKPVAGLTPEAATLLETFNWPGQCPPAREHDLPRRGLVRRLAARHRRFPRRSPPRWASTPAPRARRPRPRCRRPMRRHRATPRPRRPRIVSPYAISGTDPAGPHAQTGGCRIRDHPHGDQPLQTATCPKSPAASASAARRSTAS